MMQLTANAGADLRLLKRMVRTTFTMLLGLCLSAASAQGSSPAGPIASGAPIIRHFPADEYGSLPQLWSITQDHRGLIYVGADSGLLEFDGGRWRTISTPNEALVRSLASDANGTVFVGGVGQFGYLGPGPSGETVYHSLSDRLEEQNYRQFDNVWSTHATSHGAYFVGDNVIYRWHENQLYTIDSARRNWGFTVQDTVIIYHREGGLSHIVDGQMRDLPGTEALSSNTVGRIFIAPYSNEQIIIFSTKSGAYRYSLKTPVDAHPLVPFATEVDELLASLTLYYQGAYDSNGHYYLGTLGEAILVVNRQGKLVRKIGVEQGFDGAGVTQLYLDAGDNLWAGSLNGLYHIQLNSPWSLHPTEHVNPSSIIRTRLHQGQLYISSYHGVHYLPNDGELNPRFKAIDVPQLQTFSLDSIGEYLMAGVQSEVYAIKSTEPTRLLELDQAPMIMALGHSRQLPNHLFIGTYSQGLRLIEFAIDQGRISGREVAVPEGQLSALSIRTIEQDAQGDLWIAGETNGLYHLQFSGPNATDYHISHYDTSNGLPDTKNLGLIAQNGELAIFNAQDIYRIEVDDSGVQFVAEGIGTEHPATIEAVRYYGDGYFVQRQQQDMAFYSKTPEGTWVADRSGLRAKPSDQFSNQGTYALAGQSLWLSMSTMLYQFDPNIDKNFKRDYSALIRHVAVANETLFSGRHYQGDETIEALTLIQQASSKIPTIDYDSNTLRFEFSAPFYEFLDKIEFSYQLQGFDADWSAWSADSKKEYTNLPENDYRFLVKARNAHGHESAEAFYAFVVLPPWYRTNWAYLMYVIAAAVIITVSVRAYSWRLVKARKRLTQLVKTRTAELEASFEQLRATQNLLAKASHDAGMARVAKSILHNVGNTLSSVMTTSGMLSERTAKPVLVDKLQSALALIPEQPSDYAEFFAKNSKGAKLPNYLGALEQQLRGNHERLREDTNSLREGLHKIERILDQQRELTEAVDVREDVLVEPLLQSIVAHHELSEPRPDIVLDYDVQPSSSFMLDRLGIQTALLPLLSNAKDALDAKGHEDKRITIGAELKEQRLCLTVSDNGIGIAADRIDAIFAQSQADKEGHGSLHEAANAASQMNGRLSCSSAGPGYGACFCLELPAEPGKSAAPMRQTEPSPQAA